jgi:rhodanese-related sulfurtransferase
MVDFENDESEVSSEDLINGQHTLIDIRNMSHIALEDIQDSKQSIVLCCHRGIRSKKVVDELRSQGKKNVYSLKGGFATLQPRT